MNMQSKSRMPERINVGVSIYIRKGEQSLWENGIFQNCLYLVMLLMRSPRVKSTYLVTGGGDGGPEDAKRFLSDSPVPLHRHGNGPDETRRHDRNARAAQQRVVGEVP
ncbi:hypothetical protein NK8_23150 [Caballeronia sp. NK8]|nr:hypothetical protein NK8_23150 [Caballeronia sp. NK8]